MKTHANVSQKPLFLYGVMYQCPFKGVTILDSKRRYSTKNSTEI